MMGQRLAQNGEKSPDLGKYLAEGRLGVGWQNLFVDNLYMSLHLVVKQQRSE